MFASVTYLCFLKIFAIIYLENKDRKVCGDIMYPSNAHKFALMAQNVNRAKEEQKLLQKEIAEAHSNIEKTLLKIEYKIYEAAQEGRYACSFVMLNEECFLNQTIKKRLLEEGYSITVKHESVNVIVTIRWREDSLYTIDWESGDI